MIEEEEEGEESRENSRGAGCGTQVNTLVVYLLACQMQPKHVTFEFALYCRSLL